MRVTNCCRASSAGFSFAFALPASLSGLMLTVLTLIGLASSAWAGAESAVRPAMASATKRGENRPLATFVDICSSAGDRQSPRPVPQLVAVAPENVQGRVRARLACAREPWNRTVFAL